MLTEIPSIDTVITTGHSLGGALAVLCAFDLSIEFEEKRKLGRIQPGILEYPSPLKKLKYEPLMQRNIKCFTFGAPRVGNSHFRKAFHKKVGIENCLQGVKYALLNFS